MIISELSLPPSKVLVSIFISEYRVERRDRVGPIGVVSNRQDQARPLLYYHRSHRALRSMHAYYKDVAGYTLCKDTSFTALYYTSVSNPVPIGPHTLLLVMYTLTHKGVGGSQ